MMIFDVTFTNQRRSDLNVRCGVIFKWDYLFFISDHFENSQKLFPIYNDDKIQKR